MSIEQVITDQEGQGAEFLVEVTFQVRAPSAETAWEVVNTAALHCGLVVENVNEPERQCLSFQRGDVPYGPEQQCPDARG